MTGGCINQIGDHDLGSLIDLGPQGAARELMDNDRKKKREDQDHNLPLKADILPRDTERLRCFSAFGRNRVLRELSLLGCLHQGIVYLAHVLSRVSKSSLRY